jgi:hypothetical protein
MDLLDPPSGSIHCRKWRTIKVSDRHASGLLGAGTGRSRRAADPHRNGGSSRPAIRKRTRRQHDLPRAVRPRRAERPRSVRSRRLHRGDVGRLALLPAARWTGGGLAMWSCGGLCGDVVPAWASEPMVPSPAAFAGLAADDDHFLGVVDRCVLIQSGTAGRAGRGGEPGARARRRARQPSTAGSRMDLVAYAQHRAAGRHGVTAVTSDVSDSGTVRSILSCPYGS